MGPVQLNIYVGQKHLEHNYVIWKAYLPSFPNLLCRSGSNEVFLYNVTVCAIGRMTEICFAGVFIS